jgi:hypothetical protein
MEKKKLKVVDLDDLQPDNEPKLDIAPKEEAIVNVEEISENTKKSQQSSISLKEKKGRVEKALGKTATAEEKVNFMTKRFRFDKKEWQFEGVFLGILCVLLVYGFDHEVDNLQNLQDSSRGLMKVLIGFVVSIGTLFSKGWPLLVAVLFHFRPLRRFTNKRVEVFYDGVNVPTDLFDTVDKRRRVNWAMIKKAKIDSKKGIDYIILMDKLDDPLGHLRLDVNSRKKFYKILNTYLPPEHILRKVVNKYRKS